MKMNVKATPPTDNIFDLITQAANGKISGNAASGGRDKKPDEVVRHTVRSPLARALAAACHMARTEAIRIDREHAKVHRCDCSVPSPGDCEAAQAACTRLNYRVEALGSLVKHAISEEFPLAAANEWEILGDWSLVGKKDKPWEDVVLFPDPDCLYNTFNRRLIAIIGGDIPSETPRSPDDEFDDEDVLCVVEEPRLRAIWALSDKAEGEAEAIMPGRRSVKDGSADEEQRREYESWLGGLTVAEAARRRAAHEELQNLCATARGVFWRAVRDTIPVTADVETIGLCKDWTVTKQFDLSELKHMMSMAAMGGLLIPVSGALASALEARLKEAANR